MQKLHPKAVWLFFVHFLFVGFFILVFLGMFIAPLLMGIAEKKQMADTGMVLSSVIWKMATWWIIFLAVYFVFCYIWARLTYRFWRYQLTDNTLKIERGVIWKKYISIPFGRIQNVDIYRGVWARIFGLSDLQVQTAGYSAAPGKHGGFRSEGRLPGLAPKVAEELREQLIRKIKGGQGL